jgi:hypothetical protein
MLEQQAGQVDQPSVGGLVQRAHATLLSSIDVGTRGDEQRGNAWLRPGQCGMQGGHVELMAGGRVELTTPRQEQLGSLSPTEEARQPEWLKAVLRPRIHHPWVVTQQVFQPRRHAHRRGLVNRQALCASFVEQPLRLVRATVIQRIHEWRQSRGFGHGCRCYHGPPMIFVDYLGPVDRHRRVSEVVAREVGAAMRVPADQVAVRRIVTDDDRDEVELWIELSTDEQLYRLGRNIAQRISAGLRPDDSGPRVWVMYRVVPLNHAFLNGEPRGRGTATFE